MRLVRWLYNRFWLSPLENRVMAHLASKEFSGDTVTVDGKGFDVSQIAGYELDKEDFSRLFFLPNGSNARMVRQNATSPDGAPPGIYIVNQHPFIEHPHENSVGIYTLLRQRNGIFLGGVFVDHIFFDDKAAPDRLATVGIVLLALTAYRMGLHEITLLAGGGAPGMGNWGIPNMIGYLFWPKFGFDAPLEAGEMASYPNIAHCKTIQDVRKSDLNLWDRVCGNGRVMRFDLTTNSKSWKILLDYIQSHKEFQ